MPLPKEYYDILSSGDRPLDSPINTQSSGAYPDLTPDIIKESESAWGGVGDFLWSAGEGFTSGMSWGATDLAGATGQEPWEEMSGGEKAGWILGEGASLFAPWGPFGLLGKGSRAIAKGANRFVGKAAKEAVETGIGRLGVTEAAAVIKASEKGVNFSDEIVEGLNKAAKDDLGINWLKNLSATGKAARDASDNLTTSGTRAVMQSFKDAAIPIAEQDAARIAGEFVESLSKGNYVNDVGEWVARGLAGEVPGKVRKNMAKYLGMAAQDMMMMGAHGLISGKIKALAQGEDFDVSESLSHAAIMSLTFPLIRLLPNIPGLGKGVSESSTGIKAYMNTFKNTNYKAIQEAHGDDVVKNLLRVMVRGSKKDLWSRSELGDAFWKAGGKVYRNAGEIEKALPKMPVDDAITLLNKMNRTANQQIVKKWGPEFLKDIVGSVPRMGAGILAMNPWVVDKDAWGSMEGPELASHLFMSAVMTKGRGAWGHTDQRAYFADFTPYHEALNVLGVDAKNVESVLRFNNGRNVFEGMGLALSTHQVGREIVEIIDTSLETSTSNPTGRDYSNPDHHLAVDIGNLYNIIKNHNNPSASQVKIENLDAKTLNTIVHKLKGVKFEDGTTIDQLKYEGALVKLTTEPANHVLEIYKQMLSKLGSELGYDIAVTEQGRVTASHRQPGKEGESFSDANTVNRVLDSMADINEVTIKRGKTGDSETVNYDKIVKKSGLSKEKFNIRTREIIEDHMSIIANEYKDNNILRDPVDGNPMFNFLKQAKGVEASERVHNIATGVFPGGDKYNDGMFTGDLDTIFKLTDGRYAASIDSYRDLYKVKAKDPKALTDKEKEANEFIMENLEDLRQIFDLRKQTLGGTSSKDVKELGSVSAEGLSIVQGKWNDIYKSLPLEWKSDGAWTGHVKNLYLERLYKVRGMDRRAIGLLGFLHENNLAISGEDGSINMFSKKAIMDGIKGTVSKKDLAEYETSLNTIKQVLGGDVVREIDYSFTDSGKRQLESIDMRDYIKAAKMLGNQMFSDLLTNTQPLLSRIAEVDSGTRTRVHEISNEITSLIDTLDPSNSKNPVVDPIKSIELLKGKLEALSLAAKSKDSKGELDEAVGQLHLLIDAIDPSTRKFKVGKKKILTEAEEISGDEFGIHDALTRPLQMTLTKIYSKEYSAIDKMQEIIIKLENLSYQGKAGLGLEKADVMKIMEDLSRDWHQLYKGEADKGVKVLSELVNDVNNNGFFGDALKLIESVEHRINREVILKNEHHYLNSEGVRMAEALEAGSKINEHHRSITEILKDYDLVDKDGKIDASIKKALAINPGKALRLNVRDKIFASEKPLSQKISEWQKFRKNDAARILNDVLNSKPINKVKIMAFSEEGKTRGVLEFNDNSPHIEHPNTQYFSEKGFKVHWLDDTMSVDTGGGRLRNVSIDNYTSGQVQKFLNEAFRTNGITKEIIKGFQSIEHGIKESDIKKMLKNPTDYLFYLRLSPMNKMMFVATKQNLKLLDSEFNSWYDNALSSYSGKDKATFEKMFGHLKDKSTNSRDIVELKMLLPYLDYNGTHSEISKMITEYSGDARPSTLAKIEANMFKRGYLADGGTTQPMRMETIDWMSKNHPDKATKEEAKRHVKNGGFVTAVMGDDVASKDRSHPLNIESLEMGQLQIIGSQPKGLVSELAQAQQRSLKNMPSLMASLLDGGKFASERVAKLIMSQKGMLETDFTDSPNGAKTIIFATGDNQMLGKGYLVYHPEIAKHMPKNVDILLGDSAAKTFSGINIDGGKLESYDIATVGTGWQKSLSGISGKNQMLIPTNALGVSFTSKNESGVSISPSVFDFQSPKAIDDAIVWMGFKSKLEQIGVEWNSIHSDGGKLASYLYDLNVSKGNSMDKGETGLSKLLFTYGAMPNNPLVQKALKRLLRSSNYQSLSKAPNQGGEDNFIIPNISGDLSVPLYAELYNKRALIPGYSKEGQADRATVHYGGIGLNKNTAKRQLGNGINSNLEGEKFIFRDANGVDVTVGIENGKLEFYSTFYDKTGEGMEYKGTDNGVDTFRDANIKMDKASLKKAEDQLKVILKKVKDHNLNFSDVFRLLNGEVITKNANGKDTSFDIKLDKALKMQLGVMSHAIPVIGHDKVIFRVEKILNNMDGLTEVNVHDIRTVMQRDNDGDHLYTHTKLPWIVFKSFAKENGRKDDFQMYDRESVMNKEYINIFGVGNNGIAGERPEQVGFQNYASKLHSAKMMTGQIIGARNAISWLNRLGLNMGKDPLLKDFLKDEGISSDTWKVMDKFYDTVQNALDIHGGIHKALSSESKLKDFLFFGHKDAYEGDTGDLAFDKHNKPGLGFFKDPNFGKKRIEKEVFYELLRTLKKANMIQNDTWDERGSRAPEPFEVKDAFYNMRGLFANPTQYLAKQLARRISWVSDPSEKALLASQYADMFYKDKLDLRDTKKMTNLYYNIIQGKDTHLMKELFSLNNVSSDNIEAAFDKSIGGHLIKELVNTNGFWETNYEGIQGGDKEMFNRAGLFVKNIESFVATARMFGDDAAAQALGSEISVSSFDSGAIKPYIRNGLNNGILRELIHRQHKNLMGSLEYYRAEHFTNDTKIEKIQSRLGNLQVAMDIMDTQIAKNMVIDRPDTQIISDPKAPLNFKYLQKGQKVAVYRVKGDVQVIDKDDVGTVYNYGIEGKHLNYGQLEYVGKFDQLSQPVPTRSGYSYIVDMKPKARISQSTNEARYSNALFNATYRNEVSPESFIKENVSDFRDDVRTLRASISMDYIKTIKDSLSARVLSDGIFAMSKAREGRAIAEFVERWLPSTRDQNTDLLLRYLLQPQLVPSSYYKDAQGNEIPAYKTNQHLYKTVLEWAENNDYSDFTRNLIKDVELYASGKGTETDIGGYIRGSMDKIDYSKLGDMANPVRSLAKHLNIFFSSPILDAKLEQTINRSRSPIIKIKGNDGQMIPIRKMAKKGNYWEINSEGKGC